MTTKKITRMLELTVEKNRRFITQSGWTVCHWCSVCCTESEFALSESVARRFEIKQLSIFRLIESKRVGFTELPGGLLSVCVRCAALATERREKGEENEE